MGIYQSVSPYLELMRVSKPIGTCLLFVPYFIGSISVIDRQLPLPTIWQLIASNTAIFASAAFMLRAVGCSWNDFVDADIDRRVARTKLRPLARGAISSQAAIVFMLAQTIVWLAIVYAASWEALVWSLPVIPATIIYPFCKRFLPVPSVFLGLVFGWNVLVGARGVAEEPGFERIDNRALQGLICHFLSYTCWMSLIDMIYSFQDFRDDLKVGIFSMAVTFKGCPRIAMSVFALAQIGLLGAAGLLLDMGLPYLTATLIGAGSLDGWMIATARLESPQDCWWWFQNGGLIMQGVLSLGLMGDLLAAR